MLRIDFTREEARSHPCPFDGNFDSDGWVAFHGTSSVSERRIETEGFGWSDDLYSRPDIEAVLEVFDQLFWAGDDLGGFGVLHAFAQNDFVRDGLSSQTKPCFFAETSCRALLYACEAWAGGETARALRRALSDLHSYAGDEAFRREAQFQSWQTLRSLCPDLPIGATPESPGDVSSDHLRSLIDAYMARGIPVAHFGRPVGRPGQFSEAWLRERLAAFEPLRRRVQGCRAAFTHGLVYAVRFEPADLPWLSLEGGAGIAAWQPVQATRILGKALVSREIAVREPSHEASAMSAKRLVELMASADGLVARLMRGAAR